jgi:hypothetical protein
MTDDGVVWEAGSDTFHAELECENYEPADNHVYGPRDDAVDRGLQPCPRCVDRVSGRWRRRGVLAAAGGGLATMIGAAPGGHAAATLDADLRVVDWQPAHEDLIVALTLELSNHSAGPIDPVVIPWGRSRQSQLPWQTDATVPAGETRQFEAVDPGYAAEEKNAVALFQGYTNVVRVYNRGTEQRCETRFRVGEPRT